MGTAGTLYNLWWYFNGWEIHQTTTIEKYRSHATKNCAMLDDTMYTNNNQAEQTYGIIWSQNVHFVTTSSFNGKGSLVSSHARFFNSDFQNSRRNYVSFQ